LREQSSRFLASIPDYPAAVASIFSTLNFEAGGETHRLAWLLGWFLVTALAGVLADYGVRTLLSHFRQRWRSSAGASWSRHFFANAAVDAVALVTMFVVVDLLSDRWLPTDGVGGQHRRQGALALLRLADLGVLPEDLVPPGRRRLAASSRSTTPTPGCWRARCRC
jgi:hypothetical protein